MKKGDFCSRANHSTSFSLLLPVSAVGTAMLKLDGFEGGAVLIPKTEWTSVVITTVCWPCGKPNCNPIS